MRESQHKKKRLTDSNFFDGLRSGAKRIHQRKAQAVSITMLWQIAAQHNPLNHNFGKKGIPRITPFRDPNFAIVPCPNLLVSQIYTSRTSIGDERNTTQGEGMATQIPTNTDTTHTGLLHNITPSNHNFGKKGNMANHDIENINFAISQWPNLIATQIYTSHTYLKTQFPPKAWQSHPPPTATDQSHQQAHRQKVRTHGSPSRKDCFRGKNCEGTLHQSRREQNCEEEGPKTPLTHTILSSLERLWHHNGLFWLILASQKRTSGHTSYP